MAKGKQLRMITKDNKQFAGNKNAGNVNRIVHIEDWFDDFLNNAGDYWKETYFELLKFESEFYYTKEFIVQAKVLGVKEVVNMLKQKTPTQKIIDAIPEIVPNTLSPFETLLTKWIIADYIFIYEKVFKIDAHTFYTTIKTITKRDAKQFPIEIYIWDEIGLPADAFGVNYVFGRWRLVENKSAKNQTISTNTETQSIQSNFTLSKAFSKIDYIRIINALSKLRYFKKQNGTYPTKKEVMQALGMLANIDLRDHSNAMNKAFNSNVSLEQNIEIFKKLEQKTQQLCLNNQNKPKNSTTMD